MKLVIAAILGFALMGAARSARAQATAHPKMAPGPPHYRLIDLGPAGDSLAAGLSLMNDVGGFAGEYEYYDRASDTYPLEALIVQDCKPTVLYVHGFANSLPTAINDRGEVLIQAWNGLSYATPYPQYVDYRSFLWTDKWLLPIAALHTTKYVTATAINDAGVIVGYVGGDTTDRYGEEDYTAFVDSHGVSKALPTLGGPHAQAFAVNDRGEVAGQADLRMPKFETHACLWRNGKAIDLGTLGGANSSAYAINDRGQVVGSADTEFASPQVTDPRSQAFLWQHGHMTDLGTLGGPHSSAAAINDRGEIVGGADTGGPKPTDLGKDFAVFSWGGRIYTLDSLVVNLDGVRIVSANDINNVGDIHGAGFVPGESDSEHGFLLIPVGQSTKFAKRLAQIRLPGAPAKSSK